MWSKSSPEPEWPCLTAGQGAAAPDPPCLRQRRGWQGDRHIPLTCSLQGPPSTRPDPRLCHQAPFLGPWSFLGHGGLFPARTHLLLSSGCAEVCPKGKGKGPSTQLKLTFCWMKLAQILPE